MFARIVDFVSRPGKTRALNEIIQNRLLPILSVQPGFVDEIVLESNVEPKSSSDSELGKLGKKRSVTTRKLPGGQGGAGCFLEIDPVVRTFNVMNSSTHDIAAGSTA